jgi:hypothetical protein
MNQRLYRLGAMLARELVDLLGDLRASTWIAGLAFLKLHLF